MVTKVQEQIILGSVCGDAAILKNKRCINYYFTEGHCYKQMSYLKWKIEKLRCFGINYSEYYLNGKYGDKFRYCRFQTNVNEYFTYLRSVFYPNGIRRKIITRDVLDKLKSLGLAIWYMDDGHYNYSSKMVSISSCVSNYDIQLMFKDYFSEVWGLNSSIYSYYDHGKKVHVLHFDVESSDKFLRIIKRYVHKCMDYKLGHLLRSNKGRLKEERKKSTIRQKSSRSTENGKAQMKEYNKKYSGRIKEWFVENREHRQEYMKDYYNKNADVAKERTRKYREENREKCLKQSSDYYYNVVRPKVLKGMRKRHSLDELIFYAEERGGKCLAESYSSGSDQYEFECKNGHKFKFVWKYMSKNSKWCPECNE